MKNLNLPKEKVFLGPALIWKRALAFLIDIMILLAFVLYPFGKLFAGMLPKDYSFSEAFRLMGSARSTNLVIASFAMSLLMFIYFYKLESVMGQTVGKKIMKLYVKSDNQNIRRWQAVVRSLFLIPLFPLDLLVILDPLFMFFTGTNQRLSEILSKTRVVEVYSME